MITKPEWHKPKEKPYFHQISLDCIEKLAECFAPCYVLKRRPVLKIKITAWDLLNSFY